MALVNMRNSVEEATEAAQLSPDGTVPEYPYGLRISLCEEDVAKLGLTLPRAGQAMRIAAEGIVVSVNEHVNEGEGEVEAYVCIQIQDMSLTPFAGKRSLAKTMYPDLPEA